MKNKNILALCVAVPLFIACTPAKQTGKDFQWGELPQQPDLSWADSVGSRQEPINHITLSANSLGAVADSTVLSTTAIQKAIDSCAVSGGFSFSASSCLFYAVHSTCPSDLSHCSV